MKSIKQGQSAGVNDTCTDCGSFVDIGAVIDDQDTKLELILSGDTAEQDAQELAAKAGARFDETHSSISKEGTEVTLVLNFAYSAEKMIFQLENQL